MSSNSERCLNARQFALIGDFLLSNARRSHLYIKAQRAHTGVRTTSLYITHWLLQRHSFAAFYFMCVNVTLGTNGAFALRALTTLIRLYTFTSNNIIGAHIVSKQSVHQLVLLCLMHAVKVAAPKFS
jgi:hypothetical protein